MSKVKLVKQLFSKNEAKAVASFEREKACKEGRSVKKVEVIKAKDLYKVNKRLFEEIGNPWDEHYVVVVFYSKKDENVNEVEKVGDKLIPIETERVNVKVNQRSFTVIKYTSTVKNGKVIKRIERYVVLVGKVKENIRVHLYNSYALAA